jgi:hypothetical protein
MLPAGFLEDAGRHELVVGIAAAHPEQGRTGLECCGEVFAVVRRGVIVEQLLQRGTAETGADQGRDGDGDGPARQHDDAGHGQRCDVFDLIGEPGGQDPL